MPRSNAPRTGRRRWRWLGVPLAGALLVVAALPWLLSTPPGRRWLVDWANRSIRPSRIELASIRFSWFGPTRATGFAIVDHQGDRVLSAPRGTWDRNLWQLLTDRHQHGTMRMERAVLDIEHRADGTVSLAEALKPILRPNPRASLKVVIPDGRLQFRSARMPDVVEAKHAGLTLEALPAPGPVALKFHLVKDPSVAAQESLDFDGRFEIWKTPKGQPTDMEIALDSRSWPWSLRGDEFHALGRLSGTINARRRSGRWTTDGNAQLVGLDVSGPRLAGDHLRLDRVSGAWDVEGDKASWLVRRLDVSSPVLTLKAEGSVPDPAETPTTLEGTLDLAALGRQLPHALHLREGMTLERGTARVRIESRAVADGQAWEVEAKLAGLEARDRKRTFSLGDPAIVSASLARDRSRFQLKTFRVRSAFVNGSARGDFNRGIEGTFSLDLAGFQRQFRDLIDFGPTELAGIGEFQVHYDRTGPDYRARMAGELHDLRLATDATGPFESEVAHAAIEASGGADGSGLPRGWRVVKASMVAGDLKTELKATSVEDESRFDVSATVPVRLDEQDRRASADLRLRWGAHALDIDRARLAVSSSNGGNEQELLGLEATGRYDRHKRELRLVPPPQAPTGALALAPEGLVVAGIGTSDLRAEARLLGDAQALGRLLGGSSVDVAGTLAARLSVVSGDRGHQLVGRVEGRGLSWPAADGRRQSEGPVDLELRAFRPSGSDRLDVSRLSLASRYGTLQASGSLSDLSGRRALDLRGQLDPDWRTINSELARRVDPSVRLGGRPRPWTLKGELAGNSPDDWRKSVVGNFGFEGLEADFFGAHAGPATIAARADRGGLDFEPIDTTLNGGKLHLEPELRLDREHGLTLRLGSDSTLENAEINDEVSRRVLAFVAPVLQEATRARGRVSFDLQEAVFPLGVGPEDRSTRVEGAVLFEDVVFVPGPMTEELFDLIRMQRRPQIRLNNPVSLRIADRRVYQRGLALPLGDVTRIEMEGWVDFDGKLAMTASLPVTPALFGNNPVLGTIVDGTRISVPIGGTLQRPKIDGNALGVALRDLGKTLLDRSVGTSASELLKGLIRPRDPDAPPPPTREERRQRRMERKAQRRMDRGLEP